MSGFESPNYTQTPNDFFAMLPDMFESELRVTLIMIRQTFGFHRDGFKMGVTKLAKAAGLSRQGALDGAELAEKRGTFRRVNPEEQTEAEWELVLYLPLQSVEGGIQPVEGSPLPDGGQVRVKERIKKSIKTKVAATPKPPTPPEILIFREVTRLYPPKPNWDSVVSIISSVSARLGRPATADDLRPFFAEWTFRGFKPTNINWTSWAVTGIIPGKTGSQPQKKSNWDKTLEGVQAFLNNHSEEVFNG